MAESAATKAATVVFAAPEAAKLKAEHGDEFPGLQVETIIKKDKEGRGANHRIAHRAPVAAAAMRLAAMAAEDAQAAARLVHAFAYDIKGADTGEKLTGVLGDEASRLLAASAEASQLVAKIAANEGGWMEPAY